MRPITDADRIDWNTRQKELQALFEDPAGFEQAKKLFFRQHAEVHAGKMSPTGDLSFEDDVLDGLTEVQVRKVPDTIDRSIAWTLWHLARIEDVTMNVLVAGTEQVFQTEPWAERLGISILHTGNLMSRSQTIELSGAVDLVELKEYRIAVGRRTEEIVEDIKLSDLRKQIPPMWLARLTQVGAVTEDAQDLIEYWSRKTVGGLLLMPPTRHCFYHLEDAARIKLELTQE